MSRDQSILESSPVNLSVGEDEPIADAIEAPIRHAPQAPSGTFTAEEQEIGATFNPRFGSFIPEDEEQRLDIASGAETGFLGSTAQGFADGIIGFAYNSSKEFADDPAERIKFEMSAANYRANNPFKNFVGETLGRALSDTPIDLAVGFGLGRLGSVFRAMAKGKIVAPSSIKSLEKAGASLEKFYGKGRGNLVLKDRLVSEAIEGGIAGAISESAAQAFGKTGDLGEIIEASVGDMLASPVIGEVLRGGFKGIKFTKEATFDKWSTAISETTDFKKSDVKKALEADEELAHLLNTEFENQQGLKNLEMFRDVAEAEGRPFAGRPELEAQIKQNITDYVNAPDGVKLGMSVDDFIRFKEVVRLQKEADDIASLPRLESERGRDLDQRASDAGITVDEIVELERISLEKQAIAVKEEVDKATKVLMGDDGIKRLESADAKDARAKEADLEQLAADNDLSVDDLKKYKAANTEAQRLAVLAKMADKKIKRNTPDILDDVDLEIGKVMDDFEAGRMSDPGKKTKEGIPVTPTNLKSVILNSVSGKPATRGAIADLFYNTIVARAQAAFPKAKNAEVALSKWLDQNHLRFKKGATAKVIFKDAQTILNLPANSDNVGNLFHELGHIIENDISEEAMGILKDIYGSKFSFGTRDFSEKFAQDFELWVKQGSDSKSKTFPQKLIAAFTEAKKYLANLFWNVNDDMELSDDMRQFFDGIFDKDSFISDLATPDQRGLRVEARGIEELNAPTTAKAKALNDKLKDPIPASPELVEVARLSDSMADSLDKGEAPLASSNKDSTLNTMWNTFRKNVFPTMGAGVMTPQSLLSGLGDAGKEIWKSLEAGITRENSFLSRNWGFIEDNVSKFELTPEDVNKLSSKFTWNFGGVDREITGLELLNLHMYAKNKPLPGEKNANSAYESLINKGYLFQGDKKVTKLPAEDVNALAMERLMPQEVVKAAEMIRGSLDEMGAVQRQLLKDKGMSTKDFDLSSNYYMKLAKESVKRDKPLTIVKKDKNGNRVRVANPELTARNSGLVQKNLFETTSANHKRKGDGELLYQNPLESLMKHSDQQARLEALGDELVSAQLVLNHNQKRIADSAGSDIYEALTETLSNVAGGKRKDPITGKIQSKLFKGQVLSALSFNASPIAKQVPSLMSGLQRLGFRATSAGKYLTDAMDKELHETMIDLFPTYETRWKSSGQSADIHDAGLADSFNNIIMGGSKLSDSIKQGPLKAIESVAQYGMGGIKHADGAVIRSLYLAARDKLNIQKDFDKMDADELLQIEDTVSNVIIESQPSFHPLTRSSAQSSSSLLVRQFAMFSSQPMKNFNLMMRDIQDLSNFKIGTDEYNAARDNLVNTSKIIALQSALVAGAGTAMLTLKDVALSALRSDEDNESRDKFYQDMSRETTRFWQQNLSTTFGNLPISGQFMSTLLSKAITGQAFDIEVLGVKTYNDLLDFIGGIRGAENTSDMAKTLGKAVGTAAKIAGAPAVITQTAEAAASNL
jgi:hypothetical protein